MDKVVRLRYALARKGNWTMYFYEGELPVVGEVLTIPADRPEWIKRAWIQGFRMTVDGRVIADLDKHVRAELGEEPVAPADEPCCDGCCDVDGECCADQTCCREDSEEGDCACLTIETNETPVEETENAESGEGTDDEGSDAGRQPAGDDGVRSGEPSSDGSLPSGGDDVRDGDEPADGGSGD